MKYALLNGNKTHAKEVKSGTIARDIWFPEYEVKACVGKYRQFWKYSGEKPPFPRGYEPESEWHASWKKPILDANCEVICGENREHRADIKTDKYVIEIQKSSMDGYDVIERNVFYKNLSGNRLVWIVNIAKPWKEKRILTELVIGEKDKRFEIKWKRAWSWVKEIAKTKDTFLYLDFNPSSEKLFYAWSFKGVLFGKWANKKEIFENYLKEVLKPEYQKEIDIKEIFKET
ncbi:hypothetical protein [Tenacibaculum sp. C7A-26P2]|uniref:hypothetical protein n=1 Tax=Tenacibaculum sp. C7A-26P2 TaxID=3447504 RepID=UPI003F87A9B4